MGHRRFLPAEITYPNRCLCQIPFSAPNRFRYLLATATHERPHLQRGPTARAAYVVSINFSKKCLLL